MNPSLKNNEQIFFGRINYFTQYYSAETYLSVNPDNLFTLHNLSITKKVAVDRFDFLTNPLIKRVNICDYKQYLNLNQIFSENSYDIIHFDNSLPFEKLYIDFLNCIKFMHDNTIIFIDNTMPSLPFSTLKDKKACNFLQKWSGISKSQHSYDRFKVVLAIHDFHSEFSYCTIIDEYAPQTIVWKSPMKRNPDKLFTSLSELSAISFYESIQKLAHFYIPIKAKYLREIIGCYMSPSFFSDDAWKMILKKDMFTTLLSG